MTVPILWRYLTSAFMRIFLLSVSSFVAVLVVMRLEEIARFAAAGASWGNVILFTFYQIPYILPIAIPISCLIAALILFNRMSFAQELTSLRAAGLSLSTLTAPLIFLSVLLGIANFYISSELAPHMRAQSKALVLQMTASNPLVLLQKDALIRFKQAYLDMRTSSAGKARDVLFIARNGSTGKLGLMIAKELDVVKDDLQGKQVSFLSSLDPKIPQSYDHLVIENQAAMTTGAAGLSQFWEDAQWQLHEDYLPLRLLLAKEAVEHNGVLTRFGRAHAEFAKRSSLALASVTFTLLGLAFGMQIGRQPRRRSLGWAIAIVITFLVVFISGKSLKSLPKTAFLLYLLPHPLIALICLLVFRRTAKGVET